MSVINQVVEIVKPHIKKFVVDKLEQISNKKQETEEQQEKPDKEVEEVKELLGLSDRCNIKEYPLSKEILDKYPSYDKIEEPTIEGNPESKVILLVDDIPQTNILFNLDFKNIKKVLDLNVEENFKIVKCFGKAAGFMAYKYAVIDQNPVDYGIFDLTLGHVIRHCDMVLEVDGVDICYNIKQIHPDMKYLLCTAHSLSKNSPTVERFSTKLRNGLGDKFSEKYMNKNSNRYKPIYELIKT